MLLIQRSILGPQAWPCDGYGSRNFNGPCIASVGPPIRHRDPNLLIEPPCMISCKLRLITGLDNPIKDKRIPISLIWSAITNPPRDLHHATSENNGFGEQSHFARSTGPESEPFITQTLGALAPSRSYERVGLQPQFLFHRGLIPFGTRLKEEAIEKFTWHRREEVRTCSPFHRLQNRGRPKRENAKAQNIFSSDLPILGCHCSCRRWGLPFRRPTEGDHRSYKGFILCPLC